MKSIGYMEIRDVPDKTFISVMEDEEEIEYIYLKLATVPADMNHGTEEVTYYEFGGYPGWTEDVHRKVYIYDSNDKEIIEHWSK